MASNDFESSIAKFRSLSGTEKSFIRDIGALFGSVSDPYTLCFKCVDDNLKNCGNVANKYMSLKMKVYPFLKNFDNFLATENNREKYSSFLTKVLQRDVFALLMRTPKKTPHIKDLLVKTFFIN